MLKFTEMDQETIKDSNRKKILNLLYKKKELTKLDIAKQTGISIPTVINNINELLTEGIVMEAGVAVSTGGRKPMIISFLPDSRFTFGVDIRPDFVRIIMTNINSDIKFETSFKIQSMDNFDVIMNKIIQIINKHIETNEIPRNRILGVGFSLPGTVDEEKLMLDLAPNLKIKNIFFNKYCEDFDIPIYIENEANAAAFGEMLLGSGKELKNLIYISITQGIGTGIVIQDHLYKGKNKRAGEFGHMTIVPNGKLCNCGGRGCWELYASEKTLIENYNIAASEKIDNINDFFAILRDKNQLAKDILRDYIYYLSIGIQNIIFGLDPHYIIIGGQISNYGEYFLEELKNIIYDKNNFYSRGDTKIFSSKLKENASILGASLLPLQSLFFIYDKII